LQARAKIIARPGRIRTPHQQRERATQLTRLLAEAVYEALACKPERCVMWLLRHGAVECNHLADRGQFPHILGALGGSSETLDTPTRAAYVPAPSRV